MNGDPYTQQMPPITTAVRIGTAVHTQVQPHLAYTGQSIVGYVAIAMILGMLGFVLVGVTRHKGGL